MHITLEADYAVRIVSCLAQSGRRMEAKLIAEKTGVTLRFSLKILRKLVAGGIARSYKGIHGGYELARPLDEISLGDVIGIVEGNMVLSRCLNEDYPCNCDKATCHFHAIYDEISQMVQQRLNEVKFSDLYGDLQTE
jgi:Rrf2 family protein